MPNKEKVTRTCQTCQTCGDKEEHTVYCNLSHDLPGYRHSMEKHVCQECRLKLDSFVWCEHSRARQQKKQAEKQKGKGKKGKEDAKRGTGEVD